MGMRRYRQRIKENEELQIHYRKKDAERKRRERAKQKEVTDQSLKNIRRKKEAERKRNYRQKIRNNLKIAENEKKLELKPYSCRQTLGKALRKVKKALPLNPDKKRAVIKHVALEYARDLIKAETPNIERKIPSVVDENHVIQFYIRDDISRQAPGKRDTKSTKDSDGKKQIFQKRHMMMTVKEAFCLYKNEYPEKNIKISKFYELRPKYVLLSSAMPHNVCVCRYHANFNFLTEAIHDKLPLFPKSGKELLVQVCCDIQNESCMNSICEKCEYDIEFSLLPLDYSRNSENILIKWQQWKDIDGRAQLETIETTLYNTVNYLERQLKTFKMHCYIKTKQELYFEQEKQNLRTNNNLLVQIDFAENYSLIDQDEIQSAHWSHRQVTIFTCVMWHADKTISFSVISDYLSHNKYGVYHFLKIIFRELQQMCPKSFNKISIFSDGCAAQFKNKYTLSNLCFMEKDFSLPPVEWNFFATSHGKGAVDAIGGLVKRTVWTEVKSKRVHVKDAFEFYKCAQNKLKTTRLVFASIPEVEECKNMLDDRWITVRSIPRIQSMHHFVKNGTYSLMVGQTSTSERKEIVVFDVK